MHILSKSSYIKGLQCEKALYLSKKRPFLRDKLTMAQRLKFKRGTDVGIFAQKLYPDGINMTPSSPQQFPKKVEETLANMANPEVHTMYEAVFQYNDTLIMVDIITRDGDKWRAIEVKSSLKLSPTYYNDAALQYYVLKGCNIPLSDFQLMYLNPDYQRNGDIDIKQLFKSESVMEYAEKQTHYIDKNVNRLKQILNEPHSPLNKIGTQCRSPYVCKFMGHCWKNVPTESVLYCSTPDDEVLFDIYFNNKPIPEATREQINALKGNTYSIDYKTLFAMNPMPRPNKIAYLSLLYHCPAIPEADGERPYQRKILAYTLGSESFTKFSHCLDNHNRNHELEDELRHDLSGYEMIVCFNDIPPRESVGCTRVLNMHEVLTSSNFFHRLTKYDLTLDALESVLCGKAVESHDMMTYYALEGKTTELETGLLGETEALHDIYHFFYKS